MLRRSLLMLLCGLAAWPALSADAPWMAGKHYFPVRPAQATGLPAGKIGLTEVFSYGCPACNSFAPYMTQLQRLLPANVVVSYLPAGWIAAEDWPMFQRAYLTAQSLGIADRTHALMYAEIWAGGSLAIADPVTRGPKHDLPTIEDAARFYQRVTGVSVDKFLATARSFSIDAGIRRSDALIRAMQVERTPTLIVNGRYRADAVSAGGPAQLVQLARWLVDREAAAR